MAHSGNNMQRVRNDFAYHKPPKPADGEPLTTIRMNCKSLAEVIIALVPDGREQALALTNLEQVMFWANAGISREWPVQ